MPTARLSALLIAIALLAGCGEYKLYTEAKTANTPEAYAAYLEAYPDGVNAEEARGLLDSLDWDLATDADSSVAYEDYLAKHPDGTHAGEARSNAESAALREAERAGDRAALEGFVARYPEGALADKARKSLALMDLVPEHLEIGELRLTEGQPGRFSLDADVRNIGREPVTSARFALGFLDEAGTIVVRKTEWLVVPDDAGIKASKEQLAPLRARKSRTLHYEFPRAQAPDDWVADAAHLRLDVIELELAD